MAKQKSSNLFTMLGLVIWGDLGQVTMYRNKQAKVVAFTKTWPKKPPSHLQTITRDLMAKNAQQWHLLNAAAKAQWDTATKRASLCMTGYDLWQHYCFEHDSEAIATLERQTGTDLLWTSDYPRVISIRANASLYYAIRLRAFKGSAPAARPSDQTGPVTYRTKVLLGMLPLIPGMCTPFTTALVNYTIVLNAAAKTLTYVAAIQGPDHNCGTGIRYLDFEPGKHITYGENAACDCEDGCNITTWFKT